MIDPAVGIVVQAERPLPVDADPDRLAQALLNLAENAVRHASPGPRSSSGHSASGSVRAVEVANSGPPIPADELPRLFERFVQGAGGGGRPATPRSRTQPVRSEPATRASGCRSPGRSSWPAADGSRPPATAAARNSRSCCPWSPRRPILSHFSVSRGRRRRRLRRQRPAWAPIESQLNRGSIAMSEPLDRTKAIGPMPTRRRMAALLVGIVVVVALALPVLAADPSASSRP